MLDLIDTYIKKTFHPDLRDQFEIAFRLFDTFDLEDYDLDFEEILMQDQIEDPNAIKSQFVAKFHEKLDYIFNSMSIEMQGGVDIYTKNEILSGLDVVQNLADFVDILPVLESELLPEDILSAILTLYTELSHSDILEALKSVNPILIKSMQNLFHNKEAIAPIIDGLIPTISNLILASDAYDEYTQKKDTLGHKLIEANILFNRPIEEYAKTIGKIDSNKPIVDIAQDIYSILLLNEKGLEDPLTTYRKYSGLFFDDLKLIQKVDIELTRQMQLFEAFRAHKAVRERQSTDSISQRFKDAYPDVDP